MPNFEGTVVEYQLILSESEAERVDSSSATPSEVNFSEYELWNAPVPVLRNVTDLHVVKLDAAGREREVAGS